MFYVNPLKKKAEEALKDKTLKNNLDTFYRNYRDAHKRAYKGFEFEKLRREVELIKSKKKEEILNLFEEFKRNVEKTGAKVHQAKDSKDACEYITKVCKGLNAEYVVKSKSMTAE